MKHFFFLLIFSIIYFHSISQSNYQHWEWAKSYGGSGNDSTTDIKIKNGYLYVTGNFTSPTINWEGTILTNYGGSDIFVAKMDTAGNTIWVKNFGGTGNDKVSQLEINDNSSIALLCKSSGKSITIGTTVLNNPSNFYIELDKDGNVINANSLPSQTSASDIDIDYAGSIYLACRYSDVFTFNGITVDTTTPPPPLYRPDDTLSHFGNVLLKYNSNGEESWMKTFRGFINSSTFLSIEYNNLDTTILALFGYSGGDIINSNAIMVDETKFTVDSTILSSDIFLDNGYHGVSLDGFQTGHQGNSFILTERPSLSAAFTLLESYDNKNNFIRQDYWLLWTSDFTTQPWVHVNNLGLSENGEFIMIDTTSNLNPGKSLAIYNDDLIEVETVPIASTGLSMESRCMNNISSIYFGDSFKGDSLFLNDGIPNVTGIHLKNNGFRNIFIGKYSPAGITPLTLTSLEDTIKVCNDISSIHFDSSTILSSYGSGKLSYHWEPSASFIHPDSLNASLMMTSDTLKAFLTITDANGNYIIKPVVYFRGFETGLYLSTADTIACQENFVNLYLFGKTFVPCYATDDCGATYSFDSLNEDKSIRLICGHTGYGSSFNQSINLSLSYPYYKQYCIAPSNVQILTKRISYTYYYYTVLAGSDYAFPDSSKMHNLQKDTLQKSIFNAADGCDSIIATQLKVIQPTFVNICINGSYTFPDGTIFNNVQSDTSHVSLVQYPGNGLTTIFTKLIVNPTYHQSQSIYVCNGSNYTFPDGFIFKNIKSDTSHISFLISKPGCDSIIRTNIKISASPIIQNLSLCPGSNYTFADNTFVNNVQSDTSHSSHLISLGGCDSIIITNIHILSLPLVQDKTVCSGTSYIFPDNTTINNIQSDTSQTSYLKSIGGCDSTIITNITVHPTYKQIKDTTISWGLSYQFPDGSKDFSIVSDTEQVSSLQTMNGCDSIIITNISLCHHVDSSQSFDVCRGSNYTFPDGTVINNIQTQYASHESVFANPLISGGLCDTIIYTFLTVTEAEADTSIIKTNNTLTANATNVNYQWLDCSSNVALASAINQSFTATVSGNYAVALSENGCVDTSACYTITDSDILVHRPAVNIYPVPTSNTLTIAVQSQLNAMLAILMYDSYGKMVLSTSVALIPGSNHISINVSSLEKGVYVLKFFNSTTQETSTRSIIVD